jgi:hypothetical protein
MKRGIRVGLGLVTTAVVVIVILATVLVLLGEIGRPLQYELPASYRGWVAIRYEDPSCAGLSTHGIRVVVAIDQSGRGCYSNPAPQGWRQVRYEYVSDDGTRASIPVTGWGGGGEIWGGSYAASSKTVKFFVGSEVEFRANANAEPR